MIFYLFAITYYYELKNPLLNDYSEDNLQILVQDITHKTLSIEILEDFEIKDCAKILRLFKLTHFDYIYRRGLLKEKTMLRFGLYASNENVLIKSGQHQPPGRHGPTIK